MRLTKSSATQSVDKIVCKLVTPTQDLCRAKVAPNKLGNEEYFRALQSHKTLSQSPEDILSPEIAYMIDKEIRLQARQQRQTLQSETNANPGSSSQITSKKKPKELSSYTQWVKQKKLEDRYKHALMMRALKSKYEKELLEQQEKEEKHSENSKKIKKWEHQKITENVRKMKILKYSKAEIEIRKEQKRKEAEDNYREWLRKNMMKLKEEKRQKKVEKQKEIQEQRLKEEKIEERKRKEAENFRKWIKEKKKEKKRVKVQTKTQIKLKKPIMLAYSPNRKLGKVNDSYNEFSSEESAQSSAIENDHIRKVSSRPNLFNNFNDLSSSHAGQKREEFSEDFESGSEGGKKIVQDSFEGEESEYEEGSEDYQDSEEESSEYEEDSNDIANNSY